jgi:dTDP-4-dehydrorhamnose 3,5-epimerase-like enzyme
MRSTIFWNVMRCSLVEAYQHFRGMHCLHHQGLSKQAVCTQLAGCLFDFLLDPEDGSGTFLCYEMSVNFYQTTWFHVPEGQSVLLKFDYSSGFHKSRYFNLI